VSGREFYGGNIFEKRGKVARTRRQGTIQKKSLMNRKGKRSYRDPRGKDIHREKKDHPTSKYARRKKGDL